MMRAATLLSTTAAALALALPAGASALPIIPLGLTSLPAYQGAPFTPHAATPSHPPQNPFMAANPFSNIHNDPWMTDAYTIPGPIGRAPVASSGAGLPSLCGSLAFDTHKHIVSVCPSTIAPPQARIIDPKTLEPIDSYTLPTAPDPPGTKAYQNFSGGGYLFLDEKDRIWAPTKSNHLFVLGETHGGTKLAKVADYDLTSAIQSGERVTSALPDFHGLIWFVTKQNGKVGTLDPKTRKIHVLRVGEEIENSFAVDRGGVYIVSDKRMYRFSATKGGRPRVDWKVRYRNSGIVKPSQVDAGSGTTPTIMDGGYVAITDNADPMNVVVYRTRKKLRRHQHRVVCQVPVFHKGASATENTLLAAGRALVVENNYGYQDPFGSKSGALTTPGFARVDVNRKGTGCSRRWTNTTERGPTVVPKVSTKTGLIYTYTRDPDPAVPGSQPYFWTAISLRTGKTAFKRYAGSGLSFNNNYAGIALGPDGGEYLGVIGGIISLHDAPG